METIITSFPTAPDLACSALVDTIVKLEGQRGSAQPASSLPNRLALTEIELEDDAFHVRGGELDEHHLHKLGRALAVINDLAPVLVLQCGDRFVLVDGHHRLEAYGIAERLDIPVEVFLGSVREAVLEASLRGTVATLQMDNRQRQDCAWRLVNADFTLMEIASAAGVSRAQVSIMRKARKALGDDAAQFQRWWQAKRAAEGRVMEPLTDDEREEMKAAQAQRLADAVRKATGNKLATNPEIGAMAMAIVLGRTLPDFYGWLKQHISPAGWEFISDEENPHY